MLASVSWVGGTTGYWDVAKNWSNDAVPTSATNVSIPTSGATVTIQAGDTESVNSLTVAAGDTLSIVGGSLTTTAGLTNSGTIIVNPGCDLNVTGSYSQTAGATLSMPGGGDPINPTANWIVNSDFESPVTTNSTTSPATWWTWGSSYLSSQFAYTGSQSLVVSGANSGVTEEFPATPGSSYTASTYAMTPATNPLTGNAAGYLLLLFFNSSNNLISSYNAPNSITILTSSSATGGPLAGSVGNQGWNHFDTTAVAPSGAAYVEAQVEIYGGAAGTLVYFDDVELGPAAGGPSKLVAGSISNSGTFIVGPTNTVMTGGALTQTSAGTLDIQLGGAPSTGSYGIVDASGAATLAGTLKSDILYGYSPSTTDTFTPIEFASETGSFASETLPSGPGYQFNAAVTFTNVVISAAPTTALVATVNTSTSLHAVTSNLLGINTAYWDSDAVTTQTQQMVTAAGLDIYRFPGGSAADDFHFNIASNWNDSDAITIAQFVQFITSVGGTGVVTLDYGSGSPQEAAAELAYLDGSPTDTTLIGSGIEWNDSTSQWQTVNWGTVGYWAGLRGASPLTQDDGLNFLRIAHPAPFTDIKYWEIGNEEYGSWEIDHHGTATPAGVSTGAAHDPATYAAFAKQFASLASEIQTTAGLPQISIGIDSGDPTGASDDNWTKNVLADGLADGFVPAFISDHSYMQAPGDESDSFLLDDTVSDSGSVLDWTTRYADYQTVLQQTLGSQASRVQVMATEYNSVYSNPGKQSTSLVNGLFVAESLGSLLDSGYTGGFVWDLRNAWDASENDSNLLYGWREGGDYGQLGDPNCNSPPTTGPYVAYPGYYALQLASKIVRSGGQVVSAMSNYSNLNVYSVMESSGDLALLVINASPAASLTEQFDLTGFQPGGSAQVWQYGETQDTAQSHSATGASALAYASTSVSLGGSNFSYTFPAYSMTVLDLSPPPSLSGPTTATVGHTQTLAFSGVAAISVSDLAATGSTIDTVALSVHNGMLGVSLSGGATITAGSSGSVSLTLSGTLTQLNAALGTLVYTAPATGASDTLSAIATDGIASSTPLVTTITLTNVAPTVTNVLVSSTDWNSTFLSYLASLGSQNVSGYSIPVGSGAQLLPLPWGNINQIEVVFSENVVANQSDLLLSGVNTSAYNVGGGTFSYNPGTFTATWTLPQPIGPDKLMLALNADGSDPIQDAAGNRLDGEWTNPTSTSDTATSVYPSGNGAEGGDFDFRFNVLPGDVTQDGSVGFADLNKVLANYNDTSVSWSQGDVTGDGVVDFADLNKVLTNYNLTLPSGEPVAGSFPANAPEAAVTPTAVGSETTMPGRADGVASVAAVATNDTSGSEEPDAPAVAAEDADGQAGLTSAPAAFVAVAAPSAPDQPVTVEGAVGETTVPSQVDVIANVTTADNSGVETPDVPAVDVPTQPALVQSDAPKVFPALAAVATSQFDGLHVAASNVVGVEGWSSPPVFAVENQGLRFVVEPPASAVHSLPADGFGIAARRPTKPLADVAGNTSPWDEVVPATNGSSSPVSRASPTGMEQAVQAPPRTVFADQARAHDVVLAENGAAPSPSGMSWLSDTAGDPESVTGTIDDALAAYDHKPYDA